MLDVILEGLSHWLQYLEGYSARNIIPHLSIIMWLYAWLGLFEYFFPAEPGQPFKGRIKNFFLTSIYLFSGLILGSAVSLYLPTLPWSSISLVQCSPAFAVFLYIFSADFFFYWYHRAQHNIPALWKVHELHHSDGQLNATTTHRTFWLETILQKIFIVMPAVFVVHIESAAFPLILGIMVSWLHFTHSNIRLQLGPLTPIICGPQLHRLHHSIKPEHLDKNFAQFFPLFDIIFGTYVKPQKDEFPPTGTKDMESDVSYSMAVLSPFPYWRESLGKWLLKYSGKKN